MSIVAIRALSKRVSSLPISSYSKRYDSMMNSVSLNEYCKNVELHKKSFVEKFIGFFIKKQKNDISSDVQDIIRFVKKMPANKRFIGESVLLERSLLNVAKDINTLDIKYLPDKNGVNALTGRRLPVNKRVLMYKDKPYTGVLKHTKHSYIECGPHKDAYVRHEMDHTFGIYENGKCVAIEKAFQHENM